MKVRNLKRVMRRPNIDRKIDRNEATRLLFVSHSHFDALVRSGKLTAALCGSPGPKQLFSKAVLLAYKKRLKARQQTAWGYTTWNSMVYQLRMNASDSSFCLLERDEIVIDGVRLIGACLC